MLTLRVWRMDVKSVFRSYTRSTHNDDLGV
jgi:hypothetical protein